MACRSDLQRPEASGLRLRRSDGDRRLQKQIDKVKYVADRRDQFTDEFAPSYWRVNLRDEVLWMMVDAAFARLPWWWQRPTKGVPGEQDPHVGRGIMVEASRPQG